jgi:hypothetical protein
MGLILAKHARHVTNVSHDDDQTQNDNSKGLTVGQI